MPVSQILTAAQIRAARAILRMEQKELAERAGVSVETIKRLEKMEGEVRSTEDTIMKIRRALEMAGVEFTVGDNLYAAEGVRRTRIERVDWTRFVVQDAFTDFIQRSVDDAYRQSPRLSDKSPAEIVDAVIEAFPKARELFVQRLSAAIEHDRRVRQIRTADDFLSEDPTNSRM